MRTRNVLRALLCGLLSVAAPAMRGQAATEFQQLVKDLTLHVVASAPRWLDRSQVPADVIEAEKEVNKKKLENEQAEKGGKPKPPEILEKIAMGQIGKFYGENCLLEQAFVKNAPGVKDTVQKVVDGIKDKKSGEYWALRLAMADAYYARNMLAECRKIYNEFFTAVQKPGEDLIEFYVNSGFKWAQICVLERQYDEASKMYDGLLARPLEENTWCLLASEQVELLLRLASEAAGPKQAKKRAEYLARAEKHADKMLWKRESAPLFFGKAVAFKAHVMMLRGNLEEAQGLVMEHMPDLAELHKALLEQDPDGRQGYIKASPMPECRYLLASVLWKAVQDEANKPKANEDHIKDSLFGARVHGKRNGLGAYNHAINVFVKYPDSSWSADAGEMTEAIAAFVKTRYNKEIKTNIPAGRLVKLRKMKYQNAFDLYRGEEYEKAVAAYKEILASAPESEDSVSARGVLADCYVNLRQNAKKGSPEQADYAKLAAEAEDLVATQYKGKAEALVRVAGNETLRLAAKEKDFGERGRAQQLYDAYFANYPEHYNAAQMAFVLATQASQAEDWATAIRFYELLIKQYPKSPHVVDARQSLAFCNGKVGNEAEQEKWLREFANTTPKVSARTTAQLSLALMQQKRGFAAFQEAAEKGGEEAETMRKEAYRGVAGAIRDFRAVADGLTKALEEGGKSIDPKEREDYLLRREQALYLEAASWQRLMWPEAKVPVFRAQSVKAFEKYLATYPKGRYAPQVLVKIGTIHTADKNVEKAQDAFARLQRDFPQSEEAKNSVPRLAKTLIEMGLVSEGVAEYKKMLATTDGKYTIGQFRAAGDALLEAKRWEEADLAYAKVVEMAASLTNSASYLAPALLGQARAAQGAKNYVEARQKLDAFIEKFGRSSLVLDAYEMLVEVASIEGSSQKDDALRKNSFNTAVGALKKLRSYRVGNKPASQLTAEDRRVLDDLDLRGGEVLMRKMQAETGMNLQDAAKESRGLAIVTFQGYLMTHEPQDADAFKNMSPDQRNNLERCYANLLPLRVQGEETFRGHLMLTFAAAVAVKLIQDGLEKTSISPQSALLNLRNQKCKVYSTRSIPQEANKKANDCYKLFKVKVPTTIPR